MKNTKLVFLFAILVAADQFAKTFFFGAVCNKNIAWNIPLVPAIFYFVWPAVMAALVFCFFQTKKFSQRIFLVFIIAGGLSNIVDRIRLGCVVDYIDLKFWPIFNLADVYIIIGLIFLIALNSRKYKILDSKY